MSYTRIYSFQPDQHFTGVSDCVNLRLITSLYRPRERSAKNIADNVVGQNCFVSQAYYTVRLATALTDDSYYTTHYCIAQLALKAGKMCNGCCCRRPYVVRCPSRCHISKTKQDRPIVTMEHYQELGTADSVAAHISSPDILRVYIMVTTRAATVQRMVYCFQQCLFVGGCVSVCCRL